MDNKKRIVEAAHELFFRYGIKSVTMDDIAHHLALSKKTIYEEFEDKNKIVMSLLKKELDTHEKHFNEIEKKSKDAIDEIIHLMDYMRSIFQAMNPNMMYDMQKYHPQAWNHWKSFKNNCIYKAVERNILNGMKQALYRKDIDVKVMTRLRMEEVEMAFNPGVFPSSQFNMMHLHVSLLDHFLYGISTLTGHKLIDKHKKINEE